MISAALAATLRQPPTGLRQATLANVLTDATRLAAVEGDGLPFGSGYGVWPAATNIALRSNALNTSPWVLTGMTVAENGATDPYGGASANLITVTTADQVLSQDITVVASTAYTLSFWAKRGTKTSAEYRVFDLSNGANIVANTSYYASINGTTNTRVTVSFTTPVGCTSIRIYPLNETAGSTGTMSIWQVQLETGSIATPVITTTTGSASRSAGRVQVLVSGLLTATQGWVAGRVRMGFDSPSSGEKYLFCWRDDNSNRVGIPWDGSSAGWQVNRVAGGVGTESNVAADTFVVGDEITVVGAFTATALSVSKDGGAFVTTADANIPTLAATTFDVGSFASGSGPINSNVRWLITGKGTLTDADVARINSWGNPVPTLDQIAMLSFASKPTLLMPAKTGDMVLLPAYYEGAH